MWRRAIGLLIVIAGILVASGCAGSPDTTTIRGQIYGQALQAGPSAAASQPSNSSQTGPVRATVDCNGVTTRAGDNGTYQMSVRVANQYTCTVSARLYSPQKTVVPGFSGSGIVIDFGRVQVSSCTDEGFSSDRLTALFDCPALTLQPATVTGMVRAQSSQRGLPTASVNCLLAGSDPDAGSSLLTATTDASGAFKLTAVPPGSYGCVASGGPRSAAFQGLIAQPGQTATLTFTLCDQHCPPVHYHGGPVMHNYTAYLIFWTPPHSPPDPGGSDAHFESTVAQFFKDAGGTPYFGVLSQYFDYAGYVQNSLTLGGVWVDTRPYQHCSYSLSCTPAAASRGDPLYDEDIVAESYAALAANPSWHASLDVEFFVFTGYGAEECTSQGSNFCSFSRGKLGYCAFHGSFTQNNFDTPSLNNPPIIFAYIPDQANDGSWCAGSGYTSPNGDDVLDSAIDVTSHEMFESISDPLSYDANGAPDIAPAWYDDGSYEDNGANTEIADMCERPYATAFGAIGSDGGNITLHGHRYLAQSEWSNRANACVFA